MKQKQKQKWKKCKDKNKSNESGSLSHNTTIIIHMYTDFQDLTFIAFEKTASQIFIFQCAKYRKKEKRIQKKKKERKKN